MDVLTSQEPEIPPPQRYMDSHGADFLDPRAGAVRAVTRGRVVSINVPLVQTSQTARSAVIGVVTVHNVRAASRQVG